MMTTAEKLAWDEHEHLFSWQIQKTESKWHEITQWWGEDRGWWRQAENRQLTLTGRSGWLCVWMYLMSTGSEDSICKKNNNKRRKLTNYKDKSLTLLACSESVSICICTGVGVCWRQSFCRELERTVGEWRGLKREIGRRNRRAQKRVLMHRHYSFKLHLWREI